MVAFDFGPRFSFGRVVITRNALEQLPLDEVKAALRRHGRGDWGELTSHDLAANEWALKYEGRLLSIYAAANGTRFYIITESDRSATTILLPEDY